MKRIKGGSYVRVVKGPQTGLTGVAVKLPADSTLIRTTNRGRSNLVIVPTEFLYDQTETDKAKRKAGQEFADQMLGDITPEDVRRALRKDE